MQLLDRLRTETRQDHDRIEADLDLLSKPMTIGRYVEIIRRFHAFVRAWEPAIEAQLGAAFYGPRRKLPWLAADLIALGAEPSQRHVPGPSILDRPSAMGSLYVLEGSTLGGQVIIRHLAETGLVPLGATSFFSSYGPEVGRRWSEFKAMLAASSSPDRDGAIVRAARETFASLSAVMAPAASVRALPDDVACHV